MSQSDSEERLLDICWNRITKARNFGVKTLKARHENHFSEVMSRSEITLGSANRSQTCSNGPVTNRLKSFGAGCKNDVIDYYSNSDSDNSENNIGMDRDVNMESNLRGKGNMKGYATGLSSSLNQLEEVVDVNLISQAFMYGRYLLYSAAAHTAINLQGLWTDGPTASWNGKIETKLFTTVNTVCPSACLSICLCVCLSVCLSVCVSVCLSV